MDKQDKTKKTNISEELEAVELTDFDKAVIGMKIRYPSYTIAEIARQLERHRDTVTKSLNKETVIEALSILNKTALDILVENQVNAARRLAEIVLNGTDQYAIQAAREILKGVLSESVDHDIKIIFEDAGE
ncbi:MAG: hypothetical protein GY853_06600 [PVC group bacterium]|nr:hypothetical protein [PVC group bacterium]